MGKSRLAFTRPRARRRVDRCAAPENKTQKIQRAGPPQALERPCQDPGIRPAPHQSASWASFSLSRLRRRTLSECVVVVEPHRWYPILSRVVSHTASASLVGSREASFTSRRGQRRADVSGDLQATPPPHPARRRRGADADAPACRPQVQAQASGSGFRLRSDQEAPPEMGGHARRWRVEAALCRGDGARAALLPCCEPRRARTVGIRARPRWRRGRRLERRRGLQFRTWGAAEGREACVRGVRVQCAVEGGSAGPSPALASSAPGDLS